MFEVVCGIVMLGTVSVLTVLCWKLLGTNAQLQADHARDLTRLVMASTTASVARGDLDSGRIMTDRFSLATAQAQTQFPETLGQLVQGRKDLDQPPRDDVSGFEAESNWTARLLGDLNTGAPVQHIQPEVR